MDGERSDGGGGGRRGGAVGGGEAEVEDEFACAGMLRGSLTSLHSTVERIFMVAFGIGADDLPHGNTGQIWLKLRGPSSNVKAAKLFVKGVVNQEEQQEISYPGALNCIFCGARGLFLDCLIKSTSAHLVVGSPGFLLISGLAEPVVRAYSLITDLVERYKSIQSRRSETGDKGSGETLDSRRAFKALVEKWEDKYILDLLVLPGLVKEILLDLVKDSGLGSRTDVVMTDGNIRARDESEDRWDKPSAITYTPSDPFSAADRWVEGMNEISGAAAIDSFQLFSSSAGARGRADGAQQRLVPSPQEVWEEEQPGQRKILGIREKDVLGEEEEQEPQLSKAHKEFLLLKFFTAMGYTDDVVKRVLAQTGPKEASQILDLVQQEQDRSDRERMLEGGPEPKHKDAIAQNKSEQERNRPCETEHREEEETAVAAVAAAAAGEGRRGDDQVTSSNGDLEEVHMGEVEGAAGFTKHFEGVGAKEKEEGQEEDFVLGVVKKAAASCGYTEQKVAKVYNMLPDRSTHHLLMELQREDSKETDAFREEPREMDDVVLENVGPKVRPAENKEKSRPDDEVPKLTAPAAEPNFFQWADEPPQPPLSQYTSQSKHHQLPKTQTHQIILPDVKGPPMPIYPPALDPPLTNFQANTQFDQTIYWSKQNHSSHNTVSNQTPQSSNSGSLQPPQPGPSTFTRNDTSPTRARERRGFMPSAASSVVVTGEQRFLEGLQMPFELKLTDQPGDPKLRTIIIDGSNVAMSHGLGHFFSCRGIALAVQHFWDRGHRNISALLPQWRQKSDPKTKEQHYLMELQKLGLVSYTPSREVQGKRISSYDDRLMLQLAQKTDGVIVTNDNLRDLSDETPVWRDIIKKRLLQYTFVGDHFMVPDDPLGRGGPHLDDFLRSEHRTPDPGNHSFAGMANTFPSSKSPRSQTEVLNFRDRVLFGGLDSAGRGGGRGRGRGHGNRWDMGHQHRQHGAAGPRPERSLQETANLRDQLCQVFPDQDNTVTLVLQFNPTETDINVLSGLILEQQGD